MFLISCQKDNEDTVIEPNPPSIKDVDNDGVSDNDDNCPTISNSSQINTDSDGMGNACDNDDDNDTILDIDDNCPLIANSDQVDSDNDGIGDVCGNNGKVKCENGFAWEFPCNKYDLMARLNPASMGADRASDLWGWTDNETEKEYALICLDTGLAFVDISDPIDPVYLGTLPSPVGVGLDAAKDVKVYSNHAYIVGSLIEHGMQVFDLTKLRTVTNPPVSFSADTHFKGFGDSHNLAVNNDSAMLYAVGGNSIENNVILGGPYFINIEEPKNPVIKGSYHEGGKHHDAQVVTYRGPDVDYTGKEIYLGYSTSYDNINILDVTDAENPKVISNIVYENVTIPHQGWFTEDHLYFLMGDEGDEIQFGFNSRTLVFDLSDLDNPKLHYEYFGSTAATDHNGYVNGNRFYLANYTAGMREIDISDITNKMEETGYFDTSPQNDDPSFEGAWGVYPYFNSGNIIISDRDGGLFIIRKSGT